MTWSQFPYWLDIFFSRLGHFFVNLSYDAQVLAAGNPRAAIGVGGAGAILLVYAGLKMLPGKRPPPRRPPPPEVRRTCAHGVPVDGPKKHFCPDCALEATATAELDLRLRAQRAKKLQIQRLAADTAARESERLQRTLLLSSAELQAMAPDRFAEEIADMFLRLGYDAKLLWTEGQGDMLLTRQTQRWLLRCTTEDLTDLDVIEPFLSDILRRQLPAGFYVSTGEFSAAATSFAKSAKIELIDGPMLSALMRRSKPQATNDDGYDAICRNCGSAVRHRLHSRAPRRCQCGNLVAATLNADAPAEPVIA